MTFSKRINQPQAKAELVICIKRALILLAVFFFLLAPLRSEDYYNTAEIVSIEKTPEIIARIRNMGLDLLMEWEGRIYILAGFEELVKLQIENIPYKLEGSDLSSSNIQDAAAQSSINGEYHSYYEIEQELTAMEVSYPYLAKVFDIGDSLENRNIYALKISDNVQIDEDEAEVIFLGCHHAREWISVEVPFLLGKYLVENYETSPEIKNMVDRSEIWIIPLVNPDGLEYSIHFYRYWRKNRRLNEDGTYGVDSNRNYGYKWGLDNNGSSPNTSSEEYRGPAPFSEPETQAIRDLFAQKEFKSLISYHSFSRLIMYPWGYTNQPSEKEALLSTMAGEMASLIQSVNGSIYEYGPAGSSLYLTNGDTTDWAFGVYGIPSFTVELPPVDHMQGGFFNAENDIYPIFSENLPAMLYLIRWSIEQKNQDDVKLKKKYERLERKKLKVKYQ